ASVTGSPAPRASSPRRGVPACARWSARRSRSPARARSGCSSRTAPAIAIFEDRADRGELHVGALQHLLDALTVGGHLSPEPLARPRQFAQRLNRAGDRGVRATIRGAHGTSGPTRYRASRTTQCSTSVPAPAPYQFPASRVDPEVGGNSLRKGGWLSDTTDHCPPFVCVREALGGVFPLPPSPSARFGPVPSYTGTHRSRGYPS